LGFTKKARDQNIARIGFVSAELTKAGAAVIAAPIAPYADARAHVKQSIEQYGGFYLIHVNSPLEHCIATDRKGVYKKAQAGEIKGFTGIDDPYETPTDPDIVVDPRWLHW
ncbi:16682_t:CDS:2, partial [Dentiscutata heterogama]